MTDDGDSNQLKAILAKADPARRDEWAGLRTPALIRACARLRCRGGDDGDAVPRVTRFTLRLLAERIEQ
ncbi:hypothetical protein [Streptomyces platensis]|uniref:hypothetical protein n=1 Tax=Streptomyces platensis TaxID=58346 RepID=UPI002E268869